MAPEQENNEETHSIHQPCPDCGFELYTVIKTLPTSTLGLYNDARFPGRCILTLNKHYDNLEELESNELNDYMQEIVHVTKAMKKALQVERVNLAILGNTVSHVHAHLIPRYPNQEEFPNKSPWNDKRTLVKLSDLEVKNLTGEIGFQLNNSLNC